MRGGGAYRARMGTYGQFCPVAKALELLDERWTVLIIRELLSGSRHFNEIRRGVPKMSPALLATRLQRLTRAGVVDRVVDGNRVVYRLTPAGADLRRVVEEIGYWGVRWMPEIGDEDLDPHLLMWDMRRRVDLSAVPDGRTTIRFRFRNVPAGTRRWWLVLTPGGTDLCDSDPGFPVSVTIEADLRCLTEVWRGDRSWRDAIRSGGIAIDGPAALRRAVPRWFVRSIFADAPRSPGRRPAGDPATVTNLAR